MPGGSPGRRLPRTNDRCVSKTHGTKWAARETGCVCIEALVKLGMDRRARAKRRKEVKPPPPSLAARRANVREILAGADPWGFTRGERILAACTMRHDGVKLADLWGCDRKTIYRYRQQRQQVIIIG